MANSPSPVKIYDRPEPKKPSPVLMALALLVILVAGFFVYRYFMHPSVPAQHGANSSMHGQVTSRPDLVPIFVRAWNGVHT
jgi:hypothetical protein